MIARQNPNQTQSQPQSYPPADVKGPTPKGMFILSRREKRKYKLTSRFFFFFLIILLDSWVSTYNAAKAAGKIPNFPPSVLGGNGGGPVYPAGSESASYLEI